VLVHLGEPGGLVRLLLGQEPACKVDVEPTEVDLPAGGVLRAEGPVVEDVDEDEQAAVVLGGQLETKPIAD
jgi:hypothetical protein